MSLLTFPRGMPTSRKPLISAEGLIDNDWYYLLLSFFNRTGAGDGAPTIAINLTAIAPPDIPPLINNDWSEFSTVPANGVAQIPPIVVGSDFIVWNFGANNLFVTPQAGVKIDTLAAGAAYSLAPNKMQEFRCTAPTQIRSTQLG